MKTRWTILAIAMLGLSVIAVQRASAEYAYGTSAEVRDWSDFYEPLSPLGHWVRVDAYGWCWYPAYVESDWRPYTTGYWMQTENGWYWMSEEPWAWATYHYGRWVWDSYCGWLWVPGTEWAPAWVSWREGGDYVGWAPLPPNCGFGPQQTVIYAEHVVYAPNTFVFVERRHFCEPIRPSILIVNQTIVNKTVNITKIQKVNQVVINQGPRVDDIQRVTKRVVPFAQIKDLRADGASSTRRYIPPPQERREQPREERVAKPQPQGRQRDFGRELPIVRPVVVTSTPLAESPQHNSGQRGNDDRNRVKPQRQAVANPVAERVQPVSVQNAARVTQFIPDTRRAESSRPDRQNGRDIDTDDSPKNGRHN